MGKEFPFIPCDLHMIIYSRQRKNKGVVTSVAPENPPRPSDDYSNTPNYPSLVLWCRRRKRLSWPVWWPVLYIPSQKPWRNPQLLGNKWEGSISRTLKTSIKKGWKREKNSHILDEREVEVEIWKKGIKGVRHGQPLRRRASLYNKLVFILWRRNLTSLLENEDLFIISLTISKISNILGHNGWGRHYIFCSWESSRTKRNHLQRRNRKKGGD